MTWINGPVRAVFDLVCGPLAARPALAMAALSVLTAVWALLLFKLTTPQARLIRVRDRLLGHIYEMGMYQDRLRVLVRIQRDLAAANLRYLSLTLPALLALLIPMVLTLAQLEGRFARRPLQPGESAVLAVTLTPQQAGRLDEAVLDLPEGLALAAGPVRDPVRGAVAWRVKVVRAGVHPWQVRLGGEPVVVQDLEVAGGLPLLAHRGERGWLSPVLYPGGRPLAAAGPVQSWRLELPERDTYYLGVRLGWLAAFTILSLLAGLASKDVLRVSL